jgi:hypothetical protein
VFDGAKITSGTMNAVRGTGLRGFYTLDASRLNDATLLTRLLDEYGLFDITLSPTKPVIDGPLDIVAVRHCGSVTIVKSDGNIQDGAHAEWSALLDRLEARVLSMDWTLSSKKFASREFSHWYDEDAELQLLNGTYPTPSPLPQ